MNLSKAHIVSIFLLIALPEQSLFSEISDINQRMQPYYFDDIMESYDIDLPNIHAKLSEDSSSEKEKDRSEKIKLITEYKKLKKLSSELERLYSENISSLNQIIITDSINLNLPQIIKQLFCFLEYELNVEQTSVYIIQRGEKIQLNKSDILKISNHTRKIFKQMSKIEKLIYEEDTINDKVDDRIKIMLTDKRIRLLDLIESFIDKNPIFREDFEFDELLNENNNEFNLRMKPVYFGDVMDICDISLPSIHSTVSAYYPSELGKIIESEGEEDDDVPEMQSYGSDSSTSSTESFETDREQIVSFHEASFLPKINANDKEKIKLVEEYNKLKKLIVGSQKIFGNKRPIVSKIAITYNLNEALPQIIKRTLQFLEKELAVGRTSVFIFKHGKKITLTTSEIIKISKYTRKIFRKLINLKLWLNSEFLVKRWVTKSTKDLIDDKQMRLLDLLKEFIRINQIFKDEHEFSTALRNADSNK